MKQYFQRFLEGSLILVYTVGPIFVPVPCFAHSKGVVNCTLEWHDGRRTYAYVFSGVVSQHGRPCPNARVQLLVRTPNQPDLNQETVASAEGKYELTIKVAGNPEEPADWKLVAQAPGASIFDSIEIAGRSILTEAENTIVVERPIQLVQG